MRIANRSLRYEMDKTAASEDFGHVVRYPLDVLVADFIAEVRAGRARRGATLVAFTLTKLDIAIICGGSLPFLVGNVVILILVTSVPAPSLWLPSVLTK
jgi:hypothetical protein